MGTSTPIHSGSRWEPLPHATPIADDGALAPTADADTAVSSRPRGVRGTARRSVRLPRVVVGALLSALALGGTGTGVALARSAAPDPSSISPSRSVGAPSGQHHDHAVDEDRYAAERPPG